MPGPRPFLVSFFPARGYICIRINANCVGKHDAGKSRGLRLRFRKGEAGEGDKEEAIKERLHILFLPVATGFGRSLGFVWVLGILEIPC